MKMAGSASRKKKMMRNSAQEEDRIGLADSVIWVSR